MNRLLQGETLAGERQIPGPEPMHGQKVLITGGLGFIGSNIAHCCVGLGAEVTIYDCLDPRSGGNMHNLDGIEDDVRIILNDIRNLEGVSAAVLGQDILFSCAAFTSHPMSMREPLVDIEVNCQGMINILEAVRRFNKGVKVVHVGTSTQIGRMVHCPVDEAHPEFPVDIYSANKSVSEKYVLIYGRAYGIAATVVRLGNVYGPRSNITSSDFGFMNYFIGLGLQGKTLTVFGEGGQLRTVTYVEDAVAALVMAGQSSASDGEVLFAVSDDQVDIAHIATAIASNVGGEVQFVDWPKDREIIEIGDAVISNSKIMSTLGWSAQCRLEDGLTRTKGYYQNCLDQYLG